MKHDFIAILFLYNSDSRDSSLAFREEFSIVRTGEVTFIPAIQVAGDDLFIDGIDLLTILLTLVTINDITDCEGVE